MSAADERPAYERRRSVRVDVDRSVTTVNIEGGGLRKREIRMTNVGLGGCAVEHEFAPGGHIGVLVHAGLLLVGRVMPGSPPGVSRLEWAPSGQDADELVRVFAIPEPEG